jgi:ABC-2 type transport system ATP-binding protein
MDSDAPIIRTEKLCRAFGETLALRDLEFTVARGELFGIVGPDGAGKTTAMRILAGVLEPTSGDAWVDGVSVTDDPEAIKELIAYMPQRFGLYEDLSVIENLVFYADLFRVPRRERAERLETLFGFSRLGPFKDRAAGALSGGMKQKLALACALIHSPTLLLLDEPTNGVDPVSRRDFWKILNDLRRQGITILVTTAYLDEADRTNRVGLMDKGRLIHCDEPKAIKALVPGVFFELVVPDMTACRSTVARMPGVIDVNLFGEALHVSLEPDRDPDDLRRALGREGIEITSMRPIGAAMEDAFLALIEREENEPGSGETGR